MDNHSGGQESSCIVVEDGERPRQKTITWLNNFCVVTMELFMEIRFSLVSDIVTTKVRAVIGLYGFVMRPMTKRAFYKLLRVQEVDSPLRCERT